MEKRKKILRKIVVLLFISIFAAQVLSVLPEGQAQTGAESGSVSVIPDPVSLGSQVEIIIEVTPPSVYRLSIEVTKPDYDSDMIGYPYTDSTGHYQLYYEPESGGTYRVRVWIQGDQTGNPSVLIAQTYFDVTEGMRTGITIENWEPYNIGPCHYNIWDESDTLITSFSLDESEYRTLTDPIFLAGGLFSVTQDPLSPGYFTNIYAEPNDERSTAWVDETGTRAYVHLAKVGGATVTFTHCISGITYIYATYTGTTLEEGFQTHIWREDPPYDDIYAYTDAVAHVSPPEILAGGEFHLTVTTKYGYTTDMFIETFGGTTAPEPTPTPTGLDAIINLEEKGAVLITFYSAEVLLAAVPLDQPPVADLTYDIPEFTIVPVQAAWNSYKNNDPMIDLVAGKDTAFLVKVDVPLGSELGLNIDEVRVAEANVASNGIVAFYPITLNTPGDAVISVDYITPPTGPTIAPVTVTVRTTNDLSLYYGYLDKSAYGAPSQANYDALVTSSDDFMKGVYPVKNVAASTAYKGFKGQSSMLKDCMMIAAAALKNNRAVGVAVAPSKYFGTYGYPNGVGVSYGPNFKGVIVTEGYWTAAAHEVAHTYGLYWGEPEEYQVFPPYGQSASGVSAADGMWRSGQDFMGCAPKGTLEYTWVNNDKTYKGLFSKFTTPAVDPEIVIVSGIFHEDGTFEMPLAWSRLEQGTASDVTPGDYELVFLDANGIPFEGSDVDFEAQFCSSINMGVAVGKDTPSAEGIGLTEEDEAGFIFAVPLPPETASVEVWDNTGTPEKVDTVLASEIIDANIPAVYFTDADYNPLDSFECVFTPDKGTYKMSATNPGTFCYNLQITNMDPTQAFSVVVKIPSDFTLKPPYPGASAVQASGQPVAYEFTPGTGGMPGTLTVADIMVEEGIPKTLSVKLKYEPTRTFDSSSQTSFYAGYLFNALVNSAEALPATITAVGKKVTAIGGFLKDTNGFPKDGLTVKANEDPLLTDTTGEDGFYFIMLPAAGTYNVKVYNSVTTQLAAASLKVSKDQFVLKNFDTLNPADPAIKGFVTDAFGDGVSGVSVQLLNRQGKILATTTTNHRGGYVFRFYQPGKYTIRIAVPSGYIATVSSVTLSVKQFETAKVNFNLAVKP